MASSSGSRRYDVFPSFNGGDVRKSFLSHLLKELDRKSINTFKDHGIERSYPIAPAIKESRISIVVFTKNYASSTWCLNELVEIHKCFVELGQMVIPVFYDVDPSHVRKQIGEFGELFEKTCKDDKTEDRKQRWIQALVDVANMAGEDYQNWSDEAVMIEKIANDVSNKLFTPSDDFGDFVGIEAHIESISSMLCLEAEEVRMVGIVGPSGIGKTTIARALFSQLSSQFNYHAFVSYKRTIHNDYEMKLAWESQFLSEVLCQKDIKVRDLGMVEQMLKNKKVLIVLDNVNDLELLKTLVGETEWFGNGSRIVVITQDRKLLKCHKIDFVYKVKFPSEDMALKMLCRYAFWKNSPPDGFMELAVKVTKLTGNLPLSLSVLGSSLRDKDKQEWVEMMPMLGKGLKGEIGKILKVCYDRLDNKVDQELFLYVACLFNGESVNHIKKFLEKGVYTDVIARLKLLADKSLIRITTPDETVEMHILLQKLGIEIVGAESINDPGKRRFLVDLEDIRDVLTDKTGTKNVLGICLNKSDIDINVPLFIDENSFEGMRNLQFIKFYGGCDSNEVILNSPRGLVYLPRKLRLLHWDKYPAKYLPSSFRAEHMVELIMKNSKLEKLWEGTHNEEYLPLQRLKKMDLTESRDLKEIPNLSNAKNLEELNLNYCTSLAILPFSIQNLKKLRILLMAYCSNLEVLPTDVNLESLEHLDLKGCFRLRSFPRISKSISKLFLNETAIEEDSLWIENICGLTHLSWYRCPLRCMPSNFCTEHLVDLYMSHGKFEKLWEGVKPLENLVSMDLTWSDTLTEIPDLSKATNLEYLVLKFCLSLVMLPTNSIKNLHKLKKLDMKGCTMLEVLPSDVNLVSLEELILSQCSRLTTFPQISTNIKKLDLNRTAIEEVPTWIENISELTILDMSSCMKLKNISPRIFKLRHLKSADFINCQELTSFSDACVVPTVACITDFTSEDLKYFNFRNCFNLDPMIVERQDIETPIEDTSVDEEN